MGIRKAKDERELLAAVDFAFGYDNKIIIEKAIDMRELEVSVMGNDEIMVSSPGELLPSQEFYDYADKYLDGKTQFRIPVRLGERDRGPGEKDGPQGLPHPVPERLRPRRPVPGKGEQRGPGQRDQHHPRVHRHQHVPQAVAGAGHLLHRSCSTA